MLGGKETVNYRLSPGKPVTQRWISQGLAKESERKLFIISINSLLNIFMFGVRFFYSYPYQPEKTNILPRLLSFL